MDGVNVVFAGAKKDLHFRCTLHNRHGWWKCK
jgi:hypothetical protein